MSILYFFNSNKRKNENEKKKGFFKKYERWELQASGRGLSSFCQSASESCCPFCIPDATMHST